MALGPQLDTILAIPDEAARLQALIEAAWEFRKDDPAAAGIMARAATELAEKLGLPEGQARALSTLSIGHFQRGEYQSSQQRGLEALIALQLDASQEPAAWDRRLNSLERSTQETLSEMLTTLAVSTFRLGDYPASLLYASKEVHLKHHLGDRKGEAHALHGMGWGYDKVGLYQKALENHFQALEILEEVAPEAIASPLNGIAATYVNLESYSHALEYSRKSIEVARHQPDNQRVLSTALRCIGTIHQRQGNYQEAKVYFEKSLKVSDGYGIALNQLSLGEMHLEQGMHQTALEYFRACLADLDKGSRKRSRAQALIGIGNVYLALRQYREALRHFEEALGYAQQICSPLEIYQAHQGLARAHKGMGNFKAALAHHEAFQRYREQVINEASDVRTQVLMIQFDVERLQKDQEIHHLKHVELARAYQDLKRLNQQLERQARELERISNHDSLTGLHNRRFADNRLGEEFVRAARYQLPLTAMICDIDDFKKINDAFTHTVGDEVVKILACILRDNTRDPDIVARYGGEEFVVLFPNTPLSQAKQACEKILDIVAHHPWEELRPGLVVTISIGLATNVRVDDPRTLLSEADRQLYQAKRLGKNRVCS